MDTIRTEPRAIPIELYADLVCPWCWIGDRRLRAALETAQHEHPEIAFDVTWRPFQLDPGMPVEGRDFASFVQEKFGGSARATPMFARVADAGAPDGLAFHFDRISRFPNTVRAHALVVHAQQQGGDPWPLVEALFAAHFEQGRDTGDVDTLVEIAVTSGLNAAVARAVVTDGRYDVDIMQSQREAARLGIQGVPFVVLDQRFGISGAQPPDVFVDALRRVVGEIKGSASLIVHDQRR